MTTPDPSQLGAIKVDDPDAGSTTPATTLAAVSLSQDVRSAYEEVRDALTAPKNLSPQPRAQSLSLSPGGSLTSLDLVVGVGIGAELGPGGVPGGTELQLYTALPISEAEASSFLASQFGVSALSGSVPVRVVHTGPIDALSHRAHQRPAPGGCSTGHHAITAGTLGCLAVGNSAPRDARTLVLSNNHVLADVNSGAAGDDIVQPGVADGGVRPQHVIGLLERYVTLSFTGVNYVDAATAWVDPSAVRKELMYMRGGAPRYFRVSSTPKPAAVGMTVGKSGRTTGLRAGVVSAVGVTVRVNMGGGRVAAFADQVAIQGIRGPFSAGGDSGSLVWEWNQPHAPIGLLFAGGGGVTFANPIQRVLTALDIRLDT